MERHLLYLINPISGRGNKNALQQLVEERTTAAGFSFTILPSVADSNYKHIISFINEQNVTDIIIAGGDGTVNGAVNALRHCNVNFGILPCGSGNGLAFGAGIPRNLERALSVIFAGNAQWTDAYTVNEHFACMLSGLGFDAQVAHNFANDPSRGLKTYIKKTLSHFFTAKAYPFSISSGRDELKTEALFISIANSNQFGNNFKIAPKASLTDGLLDIVVVAKQTKLSMLIQTLRQLSGFNQLYKAEIAQAKAAVVYFQTDHLKIKNPSLAPLHIDGDPAATARSFEINVLKRAFRLIYP